MEFSIMGDFFLRAYSKISNFKSSHLHSLLSREILEIASDSRQYSNLAVQDGQNNGIVFWGRTVANRI